jgi:hypothetical protein
MGYEVRQTIEGWTVYSVLEDARGREVATYVYESDAQHIADILNDYSTREA